MKKYISRFHYLTQDLPHRSHIEQTEIACKAGANWVQYRCFSKPDEEMIQELHQVASICDDWGATLILTDHYHLLDKVDAQGVHIEDMQADFVQIRKIISDEKTLGASANTIANIERISKSGVVDYAGCGPFAHTDTKPNDLPLLETEGYREISTKMKALNIGLPILAIGGVKSEDTEALMQSGIYGIAVSSAINLAENPAEAIKDFYKKIY
ncbi:thiamine phosphate synthase [Daejeonella sp. H1SJ63]|uniref:thiamine phosphate synthase n=1 Tax=Daejeonella sp. H1SJ63 TaxID=3034145 RepID=UPI0023EB7131|nr:thiamine phosphate synthase [Daejeonella sp. H1SJ63]